MSRFLKGGPVLRLLWKARPARTVRQDWRAELSSEKAMVHDCVLAEVRNAHVMYSVALDEALTLRKWGRMELSLEQMSVSADLCGRFAAALEGLLFVMEQHARHFGTLPSVNPLDPEFFEGETARRSARTNSLLSKVLLRQQNRFLHKIQSLTEIVCNLAAENRLWADFLVNGAARAGAQAWDHLSSLQFDLTSSLGEAIVILKCFFVELPANEVAAFGDRLKATLSAAPAIANMRMAEFRKQ
jgi:hypothetical protein